LNGYLPANLSKYSMVNHEMHTASMSASLGLSMDSSSAFLCWIAGIVLRVMPKVETTTKEMDITEIN
jgi:hypothetical protein